MNTQHSFTVERATLDALPDAYALHADPADAAERLEKFRQRIAEGKVSPEQFVLLRSERGVEAVVLVSNAAHIPMFVRSRPDTAAEGRQQLFSYLLSQEPTRTLVLDSQHTPTEAAPALAVGWKLDDEEVIFQTDLKACTWALCPEAVEGGAELLERPDVRALTAELGQDDLELREGWHLVVLPDSAGQPISLGAFGPSGRPDYASINMIGVRKTERGKGLGSRLHAHLLARAAEGFGHHVGGTAADNYAMQRIFARNGSVQVAQQVYLVSAEQTE